MAGYGIICVKTPPDFFTNNQLGKRRTLKTKGLQVGQDQGAWCVHA